MKQGLSLTHLLKRGVKTLNPQHHARVSGGKHSLMGKQARFHGVRTPLWLLGFPGLSSMIPKTEAAPSALWREETASYSIQIRRRNTGKGSKQPSPHTRTQLLSQKPHPAGFC